MADSPNNPGEEVQRFLKRYKSAQEKRDRVALTIEECYEFCLPLRERVYTSNSQPQLERLFDSTAPGAIQDAASQMLDDVWPTDTKPFDLHSGPDVPEDQRPAVDRALAEVADTIVEHINNSNFRSAAHEALLDWGIGSGYLLPEAGDAIEPLRFRALPLNEAIPDLGPNNMIDALFRPRKVKAGDIKTLWPNATLPQTLADKARDHPEEEILFVEGSERDWSDRGTERWIFRVVANDSQETILEGSHTGWGSKPFVDFHFMRVAGEVLGRGPAQLALPDIKTLNLTKQFILENADLAISGAWQYDDDGTLNPDTIRIEPRSLIPKVPGTKGIEPLKSGADFNVSDLIVKDLQGAIRNVFLGDDLGPPKNTPMSATEVMERTSSRARRRAGPYSRLIGELMFQTVRRVARILIDQGKIKLPAIDGRVIKFRPLSPLTRAQAQDAVLRHDRYLELMNARFGPQVTQIMVDGQKYGEWLGRQLGVEPSLIRTKVERADLTKAIAQTVQAAQAAGIPPETIAKAAS